MNTAYHALTPILLPDQAIADIAEQHRYVRADDRAAHYVVRLLAHIKAMASAAQIAQIPTKFDDVQRIDGLTVGMPVRLAPLMTSGIPAQWDQATGRIESIQAACNVRVALDIVGHVTCGPSDVAPVSAQAQETSVPVTTPDAQDYSAREMRLIAERDAALSRAEHCEQRFDSRLDSALQVIGDQTEAITKRIDGIERVVDKFHERCSDVSVLGDRVSGIANRLGELAATTQKLEARHGRLDALTKRLDDLERRLRGG